MKHNILICLNVLGVGGVETYVVNQARALKRKGYNVYVISKKGVYNKVLEDNGIKCIEFDFKEINHIESNSTKELLSIINKYKITEVYIHNFQIINHVIMACILSNTPYMFYIHMGKGFIDGELQYLVKRNDNYEEIFKLFIKNAYKIISINEDNINYLLKKYKFLNKEQTMILKNSIDLEEYKSSTYPKKIKKILYLSRLGKEHHDAIKNTMDFYNEFNKLCGEKLHLNVTGDWEEREFAENYVKENNIKGVTFLGGISNVKERIEESDLVIALGRGILEASALNRLAIMSSYDGIKGYLNKDNIKIEFNDNFSGRKLSNCDVHNLAKELKDISQEKMKSIVDDNRKFIKKHLNLEDNLFVLDKEKYECNYDYKNIIESLLKIEDNLVKQKEYYQNKIEENWEEHVKYKEYMENKLDEAYKMSNNNKIKKLIKRIIGRK